MKDVKIISVIRNQSFFDQFFLGLVFGTDISTIAASDGKKRFLRKKPV